MRDLCVIANGLVRPEWQILAVRIHDNALIHEFWQVEYVEQEKSPAGYTQHVDEPIHNK